MGTPTTRRLHSRQAARYASDLTDDEWRLIEPYLPRPKRRGRPWTRSMREIVNGIFYVLRTGCPWRLIRPICHLDRRCGAGSGSGATRACSHGSATGSWSQIANAVAARPVRRQPWLIVSR